MKFKELLSKTEWEDIEKILFEKYPDVSDCIDGYKKVFISLLELIPSQTYFRICIKNVFDKDFDDKPYVAVYGKDGILNKELPDFKLMNEEQESLFANSEVEYAIEFVAWEEWLGMEMDKETLQNYSISEIAAHCLWEMTFSGYDQAAICEQRNELNRIAKEIGDMSDEERKERLIPWEKIQEDLEK